MRSRRRRPNRLSKKFMAGIAVILLFTFALSVFVNSRIVERYYLYQQRVYVRQVGERLKAEVEAGTDPERVVKAIEDEENVLIVSSDASKDPDELSGELRELFRQKGLGFQKFWLWDRDYLSATQNGMRFRLYRQDKLNYGILVEYLFAGSQLYAIASIIPDAGGFIRIINRFGMLLYLAAFVVAMTLIYILVRRITKPLCEMEAFTQKISAQTYGTLQIRTGDELETVAESLNRMSHDIKQAQKALEDKNRQMEELLDNVAHDLKTPLALVGMYASGMRDGLDDGTFLDTVIRQNSRMVQLTEQLLGLSGMGRKTYEMTEIRLDEILTRCLKEQDIIVRERGLNVVLNAASHVETRGNGELVYTIFSNLLSNAVKYASGGEIFITLEKTADGARFQIENEIQNETLDLNRIWDAFYVGEASRDKTRSGTGLGLAIVKKCVQQCGYSISCEKKMGKIFFVVLFCQIIVT